MLTAATTRVSVAAALYAIAVGALTLLGWARDVYRLTDWTGGGISMKANPAVGALLAGAALLLLALGPAWRWPVRVLGVPVALLGAATLAEHLFGVDFGIDTLLFDEPAGRAATMAPGRMGPPASVSFLLLGAGLVLATGSARARRLALYSAALGLAIAALSLVGYLYGVSAFYGLARYTGISFQMATAIAALGAGLQAALPEQGLVAVLRRPDAGGVMFRRLLFPLLAMALLLGFVRIEGERLALYGTEFGTAIRTVVEMFLFIALLWWTANVLSRQARALRESEERERAARLEAEHANRLKDQFLATISHELRAPLNAILGWLHLLKKESVPRETMASGLEVIDRNARVQSKLIADLLDVSRIVSGKLRLELQPVDLRGVIEAAIEGIAPSADAKQIRLQRTLDPHACAVAGDPARLQQVVGNLLSNAVKFTPARGQVELVLARAGPAAEIRIRDTGKGIRPEFLPHVFDRFRQEDARTSRAHGGLGLGLSIVKQLVELQGGTIEVASPGEGLGATFTMRLPLTETSPAAIAGEVTPVLSGVRILVVDDERDARDVLAGLLQESGATVITADSARAGLEAIAAQGPDLLLSDLAMPDGDGYAFLEEVRARGFDLPAIAVTAFAQAEDQERARRAGYQRHVAKPVEPRELFDAVRALVTSVEEAHGTQDPGHVRG